MVAYDEFKRLGLQILPDGFACHCLAGFGAGFTATGMVKKKNFFSPHSHWIAGGCCEDAIYECAARGIQRGGELFYEPDERSRPSGIL